MIIGHGKPVIRGTRLPVTVVVGSLARGMLGHGHQVEFARSDVDWSASRYSLCLTHQVRLNDDSSETAQRAMGKFRLQLLPGEERISSLTVLVGSNSLLITGAAAASRALACLESPT